MTVARQRSYKQENETIHENGLKCFVLAYKRHQTKIVEELTVFLIKYSQGNLENVLTH